MEEIIKHINNTNASYRSLDAGNAKNTDLFLDNEHYDFFEGCGENIKFRLSKQNLSQAILFIASILPRKYDQNSIHKVIEFSQDFIFDQLAILDAVFTEGGEKVDYIIQEWTTRKDVVKKTGETDKRFYFKALLKDVKYVDHHGVEQNTKFIIRNYFAGGYSDLHIKKIEGGIFDLFITNALEPYDGEICVEDRTLSYFSFKVFDYLYGVDQLKSLIPYMENTTESNIKLSSTAFSETLVGLFLEATPEEVEKKNTPKARWHTLPFNIDGRNLYLSNQWSEKDNYQLTFKELKKYISVCYNDDYTITKTNDGTYRLLKNIDPHNHEISTKKDGYPRFDNPLQLIYFGAPGTGKSNSIKRDVEDVGKKHFRTTFHPDSDYSTFVGCYKPSMTKNSQTILDYQSMVDKFKQYLEDAPVNITRACTLFGHDFHDSIVKMQEKGAHTIANLVADAYQSNTTYDTQVRAGMSIYESSHKEGNDLSKIVYRFTPQAFTNAYVEAWKTDKEVYLIIEEINRGNCAQIFGDLFQLLDRDAEGFSEYPVDADADLADYLADELKNSPRTAGWRDGVKEGKKLILPDNLFIWATMNTSDQSLFPIDSAFKRRWEWRYTPIMDHKEKGYYIKIEDVKYNWWGFLEKINSVIGSTTSSEDKKMGYFFVKTNNGKIDEKQFVGKVLFYLWNDVFKNYGFDNPIFYKGDKDHFSFSDFFKQDGEPNTDNVNKFLRKLDETIDKEHPFEIKKVEPKETPGEESVKSKEAPSETPEAEA